MSRREILDLVEAQPSTHAGLWLDKYINNNGEDAKKDLVKRVSEIMLPSGVYANFYDRWRHALKGSGVETKTAKTLGRLAISLGSESVLETSIALQRTYGAPFIPGSALKGLTAHYAKNRLSKADWGKGSAGSNTLFGSTESAGHVVFFDALYVPGSGYKNQALWPDVITVHHPEYYQSGNTPPSDWDSPVPVPFLTATGDYLVAISGPVSWVKAAFDILRFALDEEGVGAKTSSGYGRMRLED